jgi:hypothetical protein
MPAFPADNPAGNQVSCSQGFRQRAVDCQALEQGFGFGHCYPGALYEDPGGGFHRPQSFEQCPFTLPAAHLGQERATDGGHIGLPPGYGNDGDAKFLVQRRNIDHVEARHGDAL